MISSLGIIIVTVTLLGPNIMVMQISNQKKFSFDFLPANIKSLPNARNHGMVDV